MKLIKTNLTGVSYCQNKNNVSYYFTYKEQGNKHSKRKKILTKDKHLEKYLKECIIEIEDLKKELNNDSNINIPNEIRYHNYITLNELAKLHFDEKLEIKKRKLKEEYNYLSDKEFDENVNIKKRIYTLEKERKRYLKNVSHTDLGKMKLIKIHKKIIDKFLREDLGSSNLGKKSKFIIFSKIKTILNWGIRKEIINIENPFNTTRLEKGINIRDRFLNEEELLLLLKTCKEYKKNQNVYLSVYLGVLTAARSNMILNIRKKDIDIKNRTIILNNFKGTKKYKIEINETAINWLNDKILSKIEMNEYLIRPIHEFNRKKTPQPLTEIPSKVYEIMDDLFNKNLDKKNNYDRNIVCNFHTIRRSLGTNLIKKGVNIWNIMILYNHGSIKQTMDYLNITNNDLNNDLGNFHNELFKDI